MQTVTFEKLIALFEQSFQQLVVPIPPLTLERLAVMVYRAMAAQTRNFHTLEHVFALADPTDPIQSLAALFHDLVYHQVDLGFSVGIQELIAPYIEQKNGEIFVAKQPNEKSRGFIFALKLFGLQPGERLSLTNGLNEFLSALVMVEKLEGLVREKDLLRLIVCLEATIPFRGKNAQNQSRFEVIEERLHGLNRAFVLAMSQTEIEQMLTTAVTFANKDVANFAETDVAKFLDHTWKLLPEVNVALRSPELYSISEYRQALQRMEAFLSTLNPDCIFHQYRNVPTAHELQPLNALARYNVSTAREYLHMKLLATAVLEALAEVSGGDAPLSLFMGERSQKGEPARKLEDYLPLTSSPDFSDESTIFMLLDKGLLSEPSFDIKNSPLSVFLYTNLGPIKIQQLLGFSKELFTGQMKPDEFLAKIDRSIVVVIARASALMVKTRRAQLLEYSTGSATPGYQKTCV
ncbi:MAG: hypothetical protein NT075_35625 [Chloroflexi bacterium]|nr:hypothetical protein [Chloroflexota bacterium]